MNEFQAMELSKQRVAPVNPGWHKSNPNTDSILRNQSC
jgi:hypothetical protein